MKDENKKKEQLISELVVLRQQVSELKALEDERMRVEEAYRGVVQHSLQGLVIIRDGHIAFATPAIAEIIGYTVNELLSLSAEKVRTLVHPEDRAYLWTRMQDHLEGKPVPPQYEYRVIRKDGEVRWIEAFATLIEYYGKPAIQSAIIDITERKRAEEALRESEEKYRIVVENANEAIVVAQDGMLKFFNPKVIEITNYTEKELFSMPFTELIHPDDREMVVERHLARLKGEDIPHVYPFRIIDKYGNTKWVEINAVLVSWTGKPATLNFLDDITKRKRAEAELRRKNEELENFIYTVSHDLKTPLITMQGFVSALEDNYGDKLDGEAKRYLGFIQDASGTMVTLIRDLLELSRVGRAVHPKKDVDFSTVVEESLKILSSRIEEKGIELVVAQEFPRVRCDKQRMTQVVENLLANAIKFMGENSSPIVEIGHREEDGYHRFWVKDNGIGIDPRYHGKIFELFQSLKEVKDEDGTGVGLTIARKIIEHHAGRIWVESAKGKGSTFYFTLPKMSGKPKGESP